MFVAWRAAAQAGEEQALAAQKREQQAAAANIGRGAHAITVQSFNFPFRSLRSAPITIFPVNTHIVSLLLTGELMLTVEIRVEAMVDALRGEGLDARDLLEGYPVDRPLPPRLMAWRTRYPGAVLAATMEQLGIELTELRPWARAFASIHPPEGAPPRWMGLLCMSGEEQVWA
jgi:hypothetical protein